MLNNNEKAFTLIELSIVLIIIGLVIGGILAGNELINQARIKRVINDFNNIETSINTFRVKYDFLPGDFPNAGSIFNSTNCTNAPVTAGCNGNGDWKINDTNYTPRSSGAENFRVWQHLSLANLVPGNYTGTVNFTDQYISSYASNACFGARFDTPYTSMTTGYNFIELGSWDTLALICQNGLLTQLDAYSLDLKIDDGLANSGNLYGADGINYGYGLCSYPYTLVGGSPNYKISAKQGPYCHIYKKIAF